MTYMKISVNVFLFIEHTFLHIGGLIIGVE